MNHVSRSIWIIRNCINSLKLDLNPYIILTEVGSNNFVYTPIIPVLAGAKKVYAYTKDSPYGKAIDNISHCSEIITSLGIEDRIEFITCKEELISKIPEIDVITNSGFLRPINATILNKAKETIVIPLMFEAWEIRQEDIDLDLCTQKNIKVAGTWENHPSLQVFDYVKELTLKLLFEAGYEISGNGFVIWSNDHFGDMAYDVLTLNGAKNVILTNDYKELKRQLHEVDVILIYDYHEQKPYFGENGIFNLEELKLINNHFGIVHLYGEVDSQYLLSQNINVYPDRQGKHSIMTFTLSHVGLIPVLKLLTAGFKVGQELLENTISELTQPVNF